MSEARPRSRWDIAVDGGLVGLMGLVVVSLVWTDTGPGEQFEGPRWVTAWLPLLYAVPLWWRRTRPLLSASLVALGVVVQALVSLDSAEGLATILAFTVPPYSVAAFAARRPAMVGFAVMTLAFGIYTVCDVHVRAGAESDLWAVSFFAVGVLASWLLGSWVRGRREAVTAEAQLAQARRQAELATSEERARVARDLHDVVSHSLGAVVVQASGARAVHAAGGGDVEATLERIEEQSRQALTEMRHLLGVLRSPDEPVNVASAPGIADLEALALRARDAGLKIGLNVEVDPAEVPPIIARSTYRIVQEGLTNVLKHAGAVAVEISVTRGQGDLVVTVVDDGPGPGEGQPGYGLAGMRERISLLGGSFEAGAGPSGGFRVRATLPWRPA